MLWSAEAGGRIGRNGWAGALLCLVAIFLPSFLLVVGALPFWDALRKRRWAQSALTGVNAAVVGLLLAALYQPVWTAGITSAGDFALAIAAFLLLFMWQTPPWLVVILSAAAGALMQENNPKQASEENTGIDEDDAVHCRIRSPANALPIMKPTLSRILMGR